MARAGEKESLSPRNRSKLIIYFTLVVVRGNQRSRHAQPGDLFRDQSHGRLVSRQERQALRQLGLVVRLHDQDGLVIDLNCHDRIFCAPESVEQIVVSGLFALVVFFDIIRILMRS
jgi:hypothetical protein